MFNRAERLLKLGTPLVWVIWPEKLTDAGNTLFLRNTLADWSRENVDRIEVKRIAGPPPGAVLSDDDLERPQFWLTAVVKSSLADSLYLCGTRNCLYFCCLAAIPVACSFYFRIYLCGWMKFWM